MSILGLHHITLVSGDAQRTVDFYTGILGLRMVKQTVNFDAPDTYHIYFGNEAGSVGSAITFFEWPNTPQGKPGLGGTHHFALTVDTYDGLLKWKRRLTDLGVHVSGPLDRHYFASLYLRDPDGVIVEIATRGPGFAVDENAATLGQDYREPPAEMVIRNRDEARIRAETWPEPVPDVTADMALQYGMHHISAIGASIERTDTFYGDLLGLQRVKMTSNFDDPDSAHWYWGTDDGRPGTLITYFERPHDRPVVMGRGQTHHFAFAVADEDSQLAWREKLIKAGVQVTPVMERVYFKSIYMRDPDGHIVEIATAGPGFAVDEDLATLGTRLMLPPWLEQHRTAIENGLTPLNVPAWEAPAEVSA